MATYQELYNLTSDQSLIAKVTMAVAVVAEEIRLEDIATPNHAGRLQWVRSAMLNPDGEARKLLWSMLAQNRTLTVEQIQGAPDEDIKSAVNTALVMFLG